MVFRERFFGLRFGPSSLGVGVVECSGKVSKVEGPADSNGIGVSFNGLGFGSVIGSPSSLGVGVVECSGEVRQVECPTNSNGTGVSLTASDSSSSESSSLSLILSKKKRDHPPRLL